MFSSIIAKRAFSTSGMYSKKGDRTIADAAAPSTPCNNDCEAGIYTHPACPSRFFFSLTGPQIPCCSICPSLTASLPLKLGTKQGFRSKERPLQLLVATLPYDKPASRTIATHSVCQVACLSADIFFFWRAALGKPAYQKLRLKATIHGSAWRMSIGSTKV